MARSLLLSATSSCPPDSAARRGFTLVELLTVIAIIGILAAIVIPLTGRVREQARSSQCLSNLRQIGTGYLMYASAHRGVYPNKTESSSYKSMVDVITVELQPYLDHPLPPSDGSKFLFREPWRCPSGPEEWQSTYTPNFNHWGLNQHRIANPASFALYWDRGGSVTNVPGTTAPGEAWHAEDSYHTVYADGHVAAATSAELAVHMVLVK